MAAVVAKTLRACHATGVLDRALTPECIILPQGQHQGHVGTRNSHKGFRVRSCRRTKALAKRFLLPSARMGLVRSRRRIQPATASVPPMEFLNPLRR